MATGLLNDQLMTMLHNTVGNVGKIKHESMVSFVSRRYMSRKPKSSGLFV